MCAATQAHVKVQLKHLKGVPLFIEVVNYFSESPLGSARPLH